MSLASLENAMTDSQEPEVPPLIGALIRAFALLGKRWSGLVLTALAKGPTEFAEVRKQVPGISDRMLTERLRELADAGLVVRTVHHGSPTRSQYALTDHGNAFLFPLASLGVWAEEHLPPMT
ncbi:winged helix-turn-helix transcriptional regulator [Streptomyces yaanensis]|uniref:Winged helix-turn-helix transcriptional regulator n=1 Tax=Streptomyces yaanensis TaxID=1142239 RepID=A0ABV7SN14_9ACTN|nr:helix-turn-helix domain-containing protein [Streptomyces sp. CGMCC 4.7035]WNC00362.1 helix-turn-helix domain-containing protein [Streptomyces sp. CGMCC 4.7035]